MESPLETDVETVLQGGNISCENPAIDVPAAAAVGFRPICKRTVCYIVVGVVFNDEGKILMMREAKESCYGKWYLPAGRMEMNETITEGVYREVLEETGLKVAATSLVCVEVSPCWYRFTLTANVTGGSLKTYEERDDESLEARWCSIDEIAAARSGQHTDIPLRAGDILPLIDIAYEHHETSSTERHGDVLPCLVPHKQMLLRLLIVHCDRAKHDIYMICKTAPLAHLPVGQIAHTDLSVLASVYRIITESLGHAKYKFNPGGKHSTLRLMSLEHKGKPIAENDGFCMTLMVSIEIKEDQLEDLAKKPKILNKDFDWHCVKNDSIRNTIFDILDGGRPMSIPALVT